MNYIPNTEDFEEVVDGILGYLYTKGIEAEVKQSENCFDHFFINTNSKNIKVDISDMDWRNLTDAYWECYCYRKALNIFEKYFIEVNRYEIKNRRR